MSNIQMARRADQQRTSLLLSTHTLLRHLEKLSLLRRAQHWNAAATTKNTRSVERRMPSSKQGVKSNGRVVETGPQPSGLPHCVGDSIGGVDNVEHVEHATNGDTDASLINLRAFTVRCRPGLRRYYVPSDRGDPILLQQFDCDFDVHLVPVVRTYCSTYLTHPTKPA